MWVPIINKDYSILGSTLGYPYFGKPPNLLQEDEDEDSESTMAFESDIEATLILLHGFFMGSTSTPLYTTPLGSPP